MPGFVAGDGRVDDAVKKLNAVAYVRKKMLGLMLHQRLLGGRVAHHQVKLIQVLPHFLRDGFADGAGVLAGVVQTRHNRVRVALVEGHKLNNVLARRLLVVLPKQIVISGGN